MDRFWQKVDKTGECWNWTAFISKKGYGLFSVKNRSQRAHRVSYELAHGPIPDGMQVLHHCDNRRCVNPAHLFLGTNADNMADKTAKGRQARFVANGEKNHRTKLTSENVLAIRASIGRPVDLAAEYGVSPSTIVCVRSRRHWKHI